MERGRERERERERFMCCNTLHTATSGDLQREAYPQEHASTSLTPSLYDSQLYATCK